MSNHDPEFIYGKGRNQITLKGKDAIREGGWAIRWLLLARALTLVLSASAVLLMAYWRFGF